MATGDEMRVHYWRPTSKQACVQWKKKDETVPRKFKSLISAYKVKATVFWEQEDILLIEYLLQGSIVTSASYFNTILCLYNAIKDEICGKLSKQFFTTTPVLVRQIWRSGSGLEMGDVQWSAVLTRLSSFWLPLVSQTQKNMSVVVILNQATNFNSPSQTSSKIRKPCGTPLVSVNLYHECLYHIGDYVGK